MLKKILMTLIPSVAIALVIFAGSATDCHGMDVNQSQIYSDKAVINITPASNEKNIIALDVYLNTNYQGYQHYSSPAASTRQITIAGLNSHNTYDVKVTMKYKPTTTVYETTRTISMVKLIPAQVTGVKQDYWYYYIKQINASWNRQRSVNGYQYEFYNWKNALVKSEVSSSYVSSYMYSPKITNGKSYKLRARAYTDFNGQRYWGAWSNWTHFVGQTPNFTPKFKSKKLTVKWKKVTGATSYTIMVSTKANSGYKAVKTVSSKTTKATVKKFGKKKFKKGKKYYVYVRSNKKVGSTTFTSNNAGQPLYYRSLKCK